MNLSHSSVLTSLLIGAGLLSACTRPGIELPSRCRNATSLPVVLETTPPVVVCERMQPVNASEGTWPMQVLFGCDDAQTGVKQLLLSVGTAAEPGMFLDGLPLNVSTDGNSSGFVVGATLNISGLDGIFITNTSNGTGLSGVLVVSWPLFGGADDDLIVATAVC